MACRRVPRVRGPACYQIVVRGEVGERFAAAFGEVTSRATEGETSITSHAIDQSQLRRLLARLSNLGIEVISVTPVVAEAGGSG